MRKSLLGCVITLSVFLASSAYAECAVSSDSNATARPLNPTVKADTDLIVSMAMLPKMMHVDYDSSTKKSGCKLGPLVNGDNSYELWGDDSGGRHRKAVPTAKGAPVALVLPVVDIMKAITASKEGKSAQVEGYLLGTITKGDFTAWRFYTGMPDPSILKHDMADVLAGRGSPIFRSGSDGKTSLFVPKG